MDATPSPRAVPPRSSCAAWTAAGASSTTTRPDAVRRTLSARAPTRLDFGGGWTDVDPYAHDFGAAVCSVAITRYATATVALDDAPGGDADTARSPDDALVRAAL